MADFTLPGFASFLGTMAMNMKTAEHEGLEKGCQIIEAEAKRVIGTYDYGWKQLADVTKRDRVANGFPENEPLLRTGEMRDSIEHTVGKDEAQVGSNNDKALWQELGTSRGIPPRSFLGEAAARKAQEVVEAIGQSVVAHIAGRKVI
ncbi:phage virion morphogenesis protein [Xanthobacter versatilis]|uniref:hypothetical protein n=1 Tax=Xanthobacter autotrophicus (strain ATCC BAA-1158 / Py2) TaxID=78245 RepID=UPI003729ECEE